MAETRLSVVEVNNALRDRLKRELDAASRFLSLQGPVRVFVSRNPLVGLQGSRFEDAVREAGRLMGAKGFWSNEEFRAAYARGRITDADLDRAFDERAEAHPDAVIARAGGREIVARRVHRVALVHGIEALGAGEFAWHRHEREALSRLRRDVPADVLADLVARSEAEVRAGLERVGREWTLSDWVKANLDIDLPGFVRMEIDARLHEEHERGRPAREAHDEDPVVAAKRWLDALRIPGALREGYMACVRRHLAGTGTPRPDLWLRAEAHDLGHLFPEHFGARGDYAALGPALLDAPHATAAHALWFAALAALELEDPYAPRDTDPIEGSKGRGAAAEAVYERLRLVEQFGGTPVALTRGLYERIETLVRGSLARREEREALQAGSGAEIARLSWVILHEMTETRLNRRGFEALEALLSLLDHPAKYDGLLAALRGLDPHQQMLTHARAVLDEQIKLLGTELTHRDFLLALTGEDLNERVHPYVIRACAAFLDEGVAAWRMPGRSLGFYDAWRSTADEDRSFAMNDLPGFHDALRALPPLAVDAVIAALGRLGVPEEHWIRYLQKLLGSLRGWSTMVRWRQEHPGYEPQRDHPIDLFQFLAVRLFYETLLVRRVCRDTWNLDGSVLGLRRYFRARLPEFFVRRELFAGTVPEFMVERARALVEHREDRRNTEGDPWAAVADMIWLYRQSAMSDRRSGHTIHASAWRLFHLAQHLGISAGELRAMPRGEVEALLAALDAFPESAHGPLWQTAYEAHYRDEVLNALARNRERGLHTFAGARPEAQVVFCMDDREEGIRRHLEEVAPGVETHGSAGFFGVAMYYYGLDDAAPAALCPIVMTPGHEVREVAREDAAALLPVHRARVKRHELTRAASREVARNVVSGYFLVDLLGLLATVPLVSLVFSPRLYGWMRRRALSLSVPRVSTRLEFDRGRPERDPPQAAPHAGFTVDEQATRVESTLRELGLTSGFAPLVVVMGHGSSSENNPLASAYDCGACSGAPGGPNGRLFAAMANHPEVRATLAARGVRVPDDTWFVGAEHNTASEDVTWFDVEDVPAALRGALQNLVRDVDAARALSALERARRFESAPRNPTPARALAHVQARALDFSQPRPELGHATNATAIIGRRALSRGVYLDRRAYLISYDARTDPDGAVLERILLAVSPVGSGINLEYYFSCVDNAVFGCGTKLPHNVTGLIGVMDGALSDLRLGLPRQTVEVHEPMRLLVLVEASTEVLTRLYARQTLLQHLVGNEWMHLVAVDPETGAMQRFHRGSWANCAPSPRALAAVARSAECFRGKGSGPLPPQLVRHGEVHGTSSGVTPRGEPQDGPRSGAQTPAVAEAETRAPTEAPGA